MAHYIHPEKKMLVNLKFTGYGIFKQKLTDAGYWNSIPLPPTPLPQRGLTVVFSITSISTRQLDIKVNEMMGKFSST